MLALLLIALLFIVLFGGLGVAVSPLFFIALVVVLLLALSGGYWGRGHW
ncbi:MAG TPA: hydrophobic protein [Dehalococcoidia bacterium]|nr:hydrophobic protein [Dehalococcoidia bacterium]